MTYDVYVTGMRKEFFADKGSADDAFDMEPMDNYRYILFCTTCENRVRFTLSLRTSFGWCGSGYTTASWGMMDFDRVDDFGPATHVPKDHRPIKIEGAAYDASKSEFEALSFDNVRVYDDDFLDFLDTLDIDINNNVFRLSYEGCDAYYPSGGASVNEELFTELPRAFKSRPVWILSGESGTGKSTFGHILKCDGKEVMETDALNNGVLPKTIWADIIVVGNKWKNITVDAVKECLPEGCEAIDVIFKKGDLQ